MKKYYNYLVIVLVICCIIQSVYIYTSIVNESEIEGSTSTETKETSEVVYVNSMIYIDYPLLEYYFMDDNNWCLIIAYGGYGENEYCIMDDEADLESYKTNIFLNTFPVWRGTSPDGNIYLYKNSKLIKSMPFNEINTMSAEGFSLDSLKRYSKKS